MYVKVNDLYNAHMLVYEHQNNHDTLKLNGVVQENEPNIICN